MNLTDNEILKAMYGQPIIFNDLCLIYPPKLGEIAAIGVDNFYQYMSLLTIQKPDLDDNEVAHIVQDLNDFEFLVLLSQMDANQEDTIKKAFSFFTHENQITILAEPPSVLFGDAKENNIINCDNFEEFSATINFVCANFNKEDTDDDMKILPTDSPQMIAYKKKILDGRKKRRRRKKAGNSENSNLAFSDLIASLCIGSNGSLNMLNIWDLTYYSFQDQLKRMSWREEFDINTRAAMAGAKIDKSKLTHWIKTMTFK